MFHSLVNLARNLDLVRRWDLDMNGFQKTITPLLEKFILSKEQHCLKIKQSEAARDLIIMFHIITSIALMLHSNLMFRLKSIF